MSTILHGEEGGAAEIENEISQEAQFMAEGGYVQAVFAHNMLDYSQIYPKQYEIGISVKFRKKGGLFAKINPLLALQIELVLIMVTFIPYLKPYRQLGEYKIKLTILDDTDNTLIECADVHS